MSGNLTQRAPTSWTQMLSTELNSLEGQFLSGNLGPFGVTQDTATNPAFDNTLSGNLYSRMRLEIEVAFASAPLASTTIDFFIKPLGQDGSTYWDDPAGPFTLGNLSYQKSLQYLGSVGVAATMSLQRLALRHIPIGYEKFILRVFNATTANFAATGNTVWILPEADAYTGP